VGDSLANNVASIKNEKRQIKDKQPLRLVTGYLSEAALGLPSPTRKLCFYNSKGKQSNDERNGKGSETGVTK
jgi:hypothetical protein